MSRLPEMRPRAAEGAIRTRRESVAPPKSPRAPEGGERMIANHPAKPRDRGLVSDRNGARLCENARTIGGSLKISVDFRPFSAITGSAKRKSSLQMRRFQTISEFSHRCAGRPARSKWWCARRSWRDPAGASPAQVGSSVRLVASVAAWKVTTTTKRTQQSNGVWD